MKLAKHYVEKPWGRTELPQNFDSTEGRRIGEVWFEALEQADLPLLAKYIFTSERLSIQVHPNDEEAKARGFDNGKSECWYILDAEPGATLGLGLTRDLTPEGLRAASLDGSIEGLMDWKPVEAGDFFLVPPGTVHAIGPGICLLEFQQNADVTYRLYDYGRPRELHLDDGIAVASPRPYPGELVQRASVGTKVLANGPCFTLVRLDDLAAEPPSLRKKRRWVMPLEGLVSSAGEQAGSGGCLLIEPEAPIDQLTDAVLLIGAEGELLSS